MSKEDLHVERKSLISLQQQLNSQAFLNPEDLVKLQNL